MMPFNFYIAQLDNIHACPGLGWIGCICVCCSKILVTMKVDLVF